MKDTVDREAPGWAMDANQAMQGHSDQDLPETHGILAGDVALYIFTSGTTGLPKAATYKQQRLVAAANLLGSLTLRPKPGDRLYLCLPIYHITGLGPGLCGFIAAGGTVCLRRTFSASKFWSEVQAWQTNSFVYVGELCRYLVTQAPSDAEKNNPLQKMVGNGLRPDVWDEFKSRFDVNRICEIYGSSEGNVTFLNLLNKERTIGTTSVDVALVKYDVNEDTIVRDDAGRCELARPGEPGLLLGKITDITPFDGYTNAEATNSKIIENVQETGDRWFNTGDLVREIDVGFAMGLKHYQFVDRTGDTFRWRAENVSTNEVGEVLNSHPQINMANVYGVEVPGTEGRAGMVAFALEAGTDFDIDGFRALVDTRLPDYARPVFVRLQQDTETTVTFKLLKGKLREQAYHLDKVGKDRMYVRHPRSGEYRVLDDEFYQKILAAEAGY
jgi:citronellyl-CoA synthetase